MNAADAILRGAFLVAWYFVTVMLCILLVGLGLCFCLTIIGLPIGITLIAAGIKLLGAPS